MTDVPFNFNLERMKKAVEGPSVTLPPGLTREERRWYICNVRIGDKEGTFDAPQGLSLEELTAFAKRKFAEATEEA